MKPYLLLLLFSLSNCSSEEISIPEIPYPGEQKLSINQDLFSIGYINITSVSTSDNIYFKVKYNFKLGFKNTKYAFVSDIFNVNITEIKFIDLPIIGDGNTFNTLENIFQVTKEKNTNNFLIIKVFFENPGVITIEANNRYISVNFWYIVIGSFICLFLLSCFLIMCIIRKKKLKAKNAMSSEKINYSVNDAPIATNPIYDQESNS